MKRAEIKTGVLYAWSNDRELTHTYSHIYPALVLDTESLWEINAERWGYRRPDEKAWLARRVAGRESNEVGLLILRFPHSHAPDADLLAEASRITLDDITGRTYGQGTEFCNGRVRLMTSLGRQLRGPYAEVVHEVQQDRAIMAARVEEREAKYVELLTRANQVHERLTGAGITVPKPGRYQDHFSLTYEQVEQLLDRAES